MGLGLSRGLRPRTPSPSGSLAVARPASPRSAVASHVLTCSARAPPEGPARDWFTGPDRCLAPGVPRTLPAVADSRRDELARAAWELVRRLLFSETLYSRLGDAATAAGVPHPGSLKALTGLDAERPQSMRALAATMGCDASYVTSLVDTLEALGYVERRPCPDDRRVKLVQVTAEGRCAQLRAARRSPAGSARPLPRPPRRRGHSPRRLGGRGSGRALPAGERRTAPHPPVAAGGRAGGRP